MHMHNAGGNKITAKGVRQLAEREWPKLESLSFGKYGNKSAESNIGDEGLLTVLQRLSTKLTKL